MKNITYKFSLKILIVYHMGGDLHLCYYVRYWYYIYNLLVLFFWELHNYFLPWQLQYIIRRTVVKFSVHCFLQEKRIVSLRWKIKYLDVADWEIEPSNRLLRIKEGYFHTFSMSRGFEKCEVIFVVIFYRHPFCNISIFNS